MNSKSFIVNTKFIVEGVFEVQAENIRDAKQKVRDSCGFIVSGGIHSSLPDKEVLWEFGIHPIKEIGIAKKGKI